jgi:transcriptional regulator GlxA family with amidase domain
MRALWIVWLFLLLFTVAAPVAADEPYTKNVAVVIYEGVELLDFAGPAEVFAAASGFGSNGGHRAFHVYTVAATKTPIVSQGFLDVTPDYSIEDSPKPDILVLPGGNSGNVIKNAAMMEWVRKSADGAENVLTVCTGAFIAGRAGLLEGVEATTWYNAVPRLTTDFPNTAVRPGRRFVDSGKMITTAGVSAGIDGSLHLVARTHGRYVADRTAEYMEYKWAPESFNSSKYALLNPQLDAHGRSLQMALIDLSIGNVDAAIDTYRALVAQNDKDSAAWMGLGSALHTAKRYREAIAAYEHAMKSPSERGRALFNMACAWSLSGDREKAIDAAAKAVEAGFRTRHFFEHDDDLAPLRDDPRFQALVARL